MTVFDDKVYEFIILPDNWHIAKEVTIKMECIKERMDDVLGDVTEIIERSRDPKWNRALDRNYLEFIIRSGNWDIAKEVTEQMECIKERMLKEFWDDVRKKIEEQLEAEQGWKITDDNTSVNPKKISHKSWDGLFFITLHNLDGNFFFGVQPPDRASNVPEDDLLKELRKNLEETLEETLGWKIHKNDWWIGQVYTSDDFSKWPTLDKILRSNRAELAEKYAKMTIEYKNKAKPIIDGAVEKYKKTTSQPEFANNVPAS